MAKKDSSAFGGWLQRVRRTGEFSDVTVLVEGEEFHLHMLPLLNASSYFRSLPSSSKGYHFDFSFPRKVDLNNLIGGARAFSLVVDFCYVIKPTYTLENIAQIRAAAEFLGMPELLDSTKKYLYSNVFSHWRSCITFLQQYQRMQSPVDDYIESRCLKVISSACTKAFFDTKYLSVPISLSCNTGSSNSWHTSPCQVLTDMLVQTTSLPDKFVSVVIDELVNAEVNLNLKCRQGRNVKGWLDNTITAECRTTKARSWVVICLTRMLEKSVTSDRPWLELASQYWCSLLEHVGCLLKIADPEMREKLKLVNVFLEKRVGGSLHELDDYLHTYKFEPQTFISLAKHFKDMEGISQQEREDVATEVDSCLWNVVWADCVPANDFVSLIEAFPACCRNSHDLLFTAIEKLMTKGAYTPEEKQNLWRLVDPQKLSPVYREKALNNSFFICQPHVLEYVLEQHNEELTITGNEDRQNLRQIMQKVIKASLKLLEENSRRSKEIIELQKQYSFLSMGGSVPMTQHSRESSLDILKPETNPCTGLVQDVLDDDTLIIGTPAQHSTCSSVDY